MSGCMYVGAQVPSYVYDETTYKTEPGTPAAKLIYHTGISVKGSQSRVETKTMSADRVRTRSGRGNLDVAGSVGMEVAPESIGWWLKQAMGAPTTTGASPYTHVFEPGDLPVGFQLESEFEAGVLVQRFGGCRVNQASFDFPSEGFVTASFDLMAATHVLDTDVLDATPTDTGHTGFTVAEISLIEEGGLAIASVESAKITIANGLDGAHYALGGGGTRACLPEGMADIKGEITAMFHSAALLTKAINGTESSLKITLSRGDGLGSAGNESITFFVNHLDFDRTSPTLDKEAGLMLTLPFTAFRSGADKGLKITLKNAQATI